MRYLLLASIAALIFAGCANDISQEDKDFYYSGWMKPNKGAEKRFGGSYAGGNQEQADR